MYKELFGGKTAEQCLLYIANYGEGYASGIAKTFEVSQNQVRVQLEKLESGGILESQVIGSIRLFRFNQRLAVRVELETLLERMLELTSAEETEKYFRERRRPRRTGKAL